MTKTFIKFRSRSNFISLLVLVGWAGLSIKFFQIQVIEGAKYRLQGKKQVVVQKTLPALRGDIFDRNNNALTRNIIHYNLGVHPADIQDKQELAKVVSNYTSKPFDQYLHKLKSGKNFVYLERNVQKEFYSGLLENPPTGLILERNIRRRYPHSQIASQIIGCTDLDDVGITGIEKKFNSLLQGTEGWALKQRNGRGELAPKNNFQIQSPIHGSQIQLSIDLDYQCILHEELARRMVKTGAKGATGIIMNPQNGAILAMASLPSFDPNNPKYSNPEHQKIKAITDQFEPGSTFKIVAATAAIELKSITLEQEFNCENGSFLYKNLRINDHEDFGLLNISQIISNSSNIGIIKITDIVGQNNFYRFAREFGFGSLTHIDLMGEFTGTLRKTRYWSGISLAEISMGHEVGVTALQLASAFSAIANGGFLMKPRIVNQVINGYGERKYYNNPEIIRRVASQTTMRLITEMLVKTVAKGTATEASIPGWNIAGKTGTAQKFIDGKYSSDKFISNFVGFFPAENPQILGLILLDEPKMGYHWGGIGAAPVFKKIMERIINLDDSIENTKNLPKNNMLISDVVKEKYDTNNNQLIPLSHNRFKEISASIVPDVRNMSMKKAMRILKKHGLRTNIQGSGIVFWQSPVPGTNTEHGAFCTIGLH